MVAALSHIRVLDLSRVLAGPWATQQLGDFGAEVIKIERPGSGDDTRAWGPPFLVGGDGQATAESAYYLCTNRAKKSVTIDMAQPEGQRLVRDLAAKSDVVIENFKVGALRKYGLDYATLRAANPALIYCSITGFGQDGPLADRAGYDVMIQGMGGLMGITGEPAGEPMKVGVAVADLFTGMYAANAILAALAHRERTGEGQAIDIALLDAQIAMLANVASNYLVGGQLPQRHGNAHANIVPYQAFACRDGHIILAVGNDGQFARFCEIAGRPELSGDPRFATNPARVAHRDELVGMITEWMRSRDMADWIAALEAAGVPCGPINRLDAVFAHPQVVARGIRVEVPHPAGGSVPLVANPVKFSATPVSYEAAPPLLGQHTREVLAGVLGLDAAEIDRLAAARVI
ncbi:MAG: CoA transferase [Gammaproteobacteria bacterium]|nr:CoA transferase [Gammaproteobacteria bacterium]MBU1645742.1 CoA transferase [Gammaproteobacteria bacterium]MBU1971250.1 CoA transferase [Gammaproteobacteria bacterium]